MPSNKVYDRFSDLAEKLDFDARHAWLGLGNLSKIKTQNPFEAPEFKGVPIQDRVVSLMLRPEYLAWTTETLFGFQAHPFQGVILNELWVRAFPMLIASRGGSKTTLLGIYALLRALLTQGSKVLIVGSAFRQAKGVFDTCAYYWYKSPMLRNLVGGDRNQGPHYEVDRCSMRLGDSTITAIPLGNGEKIRGLRASHLLVDEFKSVPLEIVENVVFGFAAVSQDPLEKVKVSAYRKYLQDHNVWTAEMDEVEEGKLSSNQTVISGTAYYSFNHFSAYYDRYKKFIKCQNNAEKYQRLFNAEMPPKFNSNDFSVIKLPAKLLPDQFMDEKILARTKATVSKSNYLCEYGAVFVSDSDGFFKRSLVEGCVVGQPGKPISHPSSGEIFFKASMKGRAGCKYVIGVDPASQIDNFAVKVLEIWPDHRRIVYAWALRKVDYEKAKKEGLTKEKTFYSFCARKLRSLLTLFSPCIRLAMDSQGGGHQIAESLNDTDKLLPGELFIWPIKDPDPKKKKDTDDLAGLHILELVSFSSADWTSQANHGLKKDLEDKILLFPYYDHAEVQLAIEMDREAGLIDVNPLTGETTRLTDTLEDCLENIEDLKDELASIQHMETAAGRERWDVPERKAEGSTKGHQRKDRYSALLIANAAARIIALTPDGGPPPPPVTGAAIHLGSRSSFLPHNQPSGPPTGPEWWVAGVGNFTGAVIRGIKG